MNSDGTNDLVILHNRSTESGAITVACSVNGLISNSNDNLWVESNLTSILVGHFSETTDGIVVLDNTTGVLRIFSDASWHTINLATTTANRAVSLSLFSQSYDDIVLTDPLSGTVIIYNGTSIDSPSHVPLTLTVPTLSSPTSVSSSDVNRDGHTDLVVGCEGGFVIFYYDIISQNFHDDDSIYYDVIPLTMAPSIQWTLTGDLNVWTDQATGAHVQMADVAVINSTTNRIDIYFQQTGGTFSTAGSKMQSILVSLGDIIWADLADVNSDGYTDIIVATDNGKIVAYIQKEILLGFSSSDHMVYSSTDGIRTAAVGDYDDDGFSEIVIIGSDVSSATLIQGSGSALRSEYVQTAGAGNCTIAIGDVDNDDRKDLVVGSPGSGSVSIWYQRNIAPHASWYSEIDIPTEGEQTVLNAADSWDSYSDNESLLYTWKWRLVGADTWTDIATASSDETVNYAFPSWGLYEVGLQVSDGSGGEDWLNKTLRVRDGIPNAGFEYSGTLLEGLSITFTDTSTSPKDEIIYFEWDFGDGTPHLFLTSNDTLVQHAYRSNGVYNASLTIKDDTLNQSTATHTITIGDSGPMFSISRSLMTMMEGDDVTFTAVVTSPDAVVNYHWSIENGTETVDGTSDSVAHRFLTNGQFYVNLTIEENDGDVSTRSILVVVQDSIPTAGFTMSDTQVDEGESVKFQDTSSAYDKPISRYWQFGNGKTSTAQSPIISYDAHGNFTVTLWIRDSDGDNISASRTISIVDTDPKIAGLLTTSTGEKNFTKGVAVSFVITVYPGAEDPVYHWNITSSSTTPYTAYTDGPSLSYTFTKAGSYHIVLRVSDSNGFELIST
ncbi:MAG: PKD domain-containing protein, partial [Methanomassiliicoccales archaeon]